MFLGKSSRYIFLDQGLFDRDDNFTLNQKISLNDKEQKVTEENFIKQQNIYPQLFDGNVLLTEIITKDDDLLHLTITPCKYSQFLASQKMLIDKKIRVSGTAVILITNDNYIVIGSRDINRDSFDKTKYPIFAY